MRALKQIASFCIFLAAMTLQAQDKNFVASAPASVQLGQQFQYTIQGGEQGQIQLPELTDFDLLSGPFTSFSSSTQWVNGKMKAETVASYTYVLRGRSAGEFVIPPAKVKIRKDIIETNEVRVSVTASSNTQASTPNQAASSGTAARTSATGDVSDDPPVFLRVIPSRTSMYVGEQFVSELKVYTTVNTRPVGGQKEVPYEGFYKQTLDPDQTSSREVINGQQHVTQVLQRHLLIPQKAGKVIIEPFESEWTIPQRVSSSRSGSVFDDFFNDPFFDRYQDVPVTLSTRPLTIQVKPLPENAPASFTGGVGNFKFSAELSGQILKVNDALSLKVTISGTGNIPLIAAPKIDFPPDHDVYETTKSIKVNTSGNKLSGTLTYEYPIVARHAGSFRIAPVKFSWFDPASARYVSASSEEFTFTVEKGEHDDDGNQIYLPGLRGEEVRNIGTDILDISRAVPVFTTLGSSPLNKKTYWFAYGVLLLIFLGLIVFLKVYLRQKADVRLSRNRKANKLARIRLRVAEKARKSGDSEKFFEELEKAIWGYLSDKLNIEQSGLSRDRVAELLAGSGLDPDLEQEIRQIIDECEFSRYAPASEKSDLDHLYSDATRLINKLEQNIRSK